MDKLTNLIKDLKESEGDEAAFRVGKNTLIIGGSIMAVYLLLELLISDDDADKSPSNNQTKGDRTIVVQAASPHSWVTKAVGTYVLTWLLGLAREKLTDFLATQKDTNAGNDTNTTSEI